MRVNVTIEEVRRDPDEVLHRVRDGETLVVTDQERPIAEIRPIALVREPRPYGLASGLFAVPDDFDAPLPDELIDLFER